MEVKLLEVRDHGTFMPVIAIRLSAANEAERWLLGRAGYGLTPDEQGQYVLLAGLEADKGLTYSPHEHRPGTRTLMVAHGHAILHWETLEHGAVIDVAFITGESTVAKTSERFTSRIPGEESDVRTEAR